MKNIIVNFVALRGGGCIYSLEVTKAMCKNGHNVYAIVSSKMDNLEEWKSIPSLHLIIVRGYSNKINFFLNYFRLRLIESRHIKQELKNIAFDIVYIPFVGYWTETLQRYLKGKRTVLTAHDVTPHDNRESYISKSQIRLGRKCDDIIVLSKTFVKDASRVFCKEIDNVYVLPHGNCFQLSANKHVSAQYPLDKFNYIYYGQITDYKGIDVLLKAFKIVYSIRRDVSLTIAGNGDLSPYRELIDTIDSSHIYIVNRWILNDEVPELFSGLKQVAVLPYKNATQSGVIPLSMHLKTPVLATKCPGLVEQIEDNNTGFLAEVDDPNDLAQKMLNIINNWERALIVADNAFKHIESLNWENIVNIYLEKV